MLDLNKQWLLRVFELGKLSCRVLRHTDSAKEEGSSLTSKAVDIRPGSIRVNNFYLTLNFWLKVCHLNLKYGFCKKFKLWIIFRNVHTLICETPFPWKAWLKIKTGTTIYFSKNGLIINKRMKIHQNKEYSFSQPLKLAKICHVRISCCLLFVEIIGLRAWVRLESRLWNSRLFTVFKTTSFTVHTVYTWEKNESVHSRIIKIEQFWK